MNYVDYRSEILGQLSDSTIYRKLTYDPTKELMQKVTNTVTRGLQAGYITETIAAYLIVKYPKVPILYTIPKIHKNSQTPPGRPIVSARGRVLEPLGKFIDFVSKDTMKHLNPCLKDTMQLIKKIECLTLPSTPCLFATMDVKNLYTTIPHEEAVA